MSEARYAHKVRLLLAHREARAAPAPKAPPPAPPRPAAAPRQEPPPRSRWWPWGKRSDREDDVVEVAVGVDSPSDLFNLRRCDLCGETTWLPVERARALRIACRKCAARLRARAADPTPRRSTEKPPARSQPPKAATPPDPKGDARRGAQLASFLEREVAEGHAFLAKYGPPDGAEERARAIGEWNEDHARAVEADLTETMALGIPRRQGESDADYVARLKRTADRWRTQRARALFPPTPAGAAPPPPAPPASRRSAQRGGRTTG